MKKTLAGTFAVFILMLSACQPPLDPMKVEVMSLADQQQKQSYALGASLGQISKEQITTQKQYSIEYDEATIVKGFIAALQGQSQPLHCKDNHN